MNMRVDKFLKNSRLIKRRPVAKEACESGRVWVNEKRAKAGTEVKVEDKVRIRFGAREILVRILALPEAPRKEEAADMYEIMEQV